MNFISHPGEGKDRVRVDYNAHSDDSLCVLGAYSWLSTFSDPRRGKEESQHLQSMTHAVHFTCTLHTLTLTAVLEHTWLLDD